MTVHFERIEEMTVPNSRLATPVVPPQLLLFEWM